MNCTVLGENTFVDGKLTTDLRELHNSFYEKNTSRGFSAGISLAGEGVANGIRVYSSGVATKGDFGIAKSLIKLSNPQSASNSGSSTNNKNSNTNNNPKDTNEHPNGKYVEHIKHNPNL